MTWTYTCCTTPSHLPIRHTNRPITASYPTVHTRTIKDLSTLLGSSRSTLLHRVTTSHAQLLTPLAHMHPSLVLIINCLFHSLILPWHKKVTHVQLQIQLQTHMSPFFEGHMSIQIVQRYAGLTMHIQTSHALQCNCISHSNMRRNQQKCARSAPPMCVTLVRAHYIGNAIIPEDHPHDL